MYEIIFTKEASKEVDLLKKSSSFIILKRLSVLLHELEIHPTLGTGKPKNLRYKYAGYWSRRITKKHRMVYMIDNEDMKILVISISGHYDDK